MQFVSATLALCGTLLPSPFHAFLSLVARPDTLCIAVPYDVNKDKKYIKAGITALALCTTSCYPLHLKCLAVPCPQDRGIDKGPCKGSQLSSPEL